MAKKDDEAQCLFRLPKTLKAAGKERAGSKDMTMAQYLRWLMREDMKPRQTTATRNEVVMNMPRRHGERDAEYQLRVANALLALLGAGET